LQIVFAQRNFRCATIVTITQSVAIHCEALANTVEGYIAARAILFASETVNSFRCWSDEFWQYRDKYDFCAEIWGLGKWSV